MKMMIHSVQPHHKVVLNLERLLNPSVADSLKQNTHKAKNAIVETHSCQKSSTLCLNTLCLSTPTLVHR